MIRHQHPDTRQTRMPTTENNLSLKSLTPVRGAVLCAIASLAGAGSAYAVPITCYTPPDGVMRTARNCVNPSDIPRFVAALPIPGALTATPGNTGLLPDTLNYNVVLSEGTQQILPAVTAAGAATGFMPSTIWGYADGTTGAPVSTPGSAVIVTKNTPTQITYNNQLPVIHPLAISQDWGLTSSMPFTAGFTDPIFGTTFGAGPGTGLDNRVAVHNHGLAATALSDGASWDIFPNALSGTGPLANQTIYTYPNSQNAALYWFHDHAMGQTRLNAYLGLAAPYIIRDPAHPIDAMLLKAPGTVGALPAAYELPLVIQDRDFTDVTSTPNKNEQYYEEAPAGPERYGSVWMVNGATTPFVNVKNHVYRLRLLNGSQARVATLKLHIEAGNTATNNQRVTWKPAMYVIGHEQGANPTLTAAVQSVTIAPGERLDLLLDFRLAGKQGNGNLKFLLVNTAPAPFPGGAPCIAAGAVGGPATGTLVNSTGQPLASANQLNNCIPQPVWAYNATTGLPTAKATPISQVMEFRLTKDTVPGATPSTVANAPATALDTWMPVASAPITAKKIDPNAQTLEAQVMAKYCTQPATVTALAGKVCNIPNLVAIGTIKERVFPLYDLPFTNLALGGPMQLQGSDLRYGVNIDNAHYTDPGSVNAGLPLEAVQNTMTAPAGTDIVEEVWTYINTTPDSHPMHEHLFAMQAINREYLDAIRFQNDALGYPLSTTSWVTTAGGTPSTLLPANPLALPLWGDNTPGAALDPLFALPANFTPPTAWSTRVAVNYQDYLAKATGTATPCGPYTTAVPAATLGCITGSDAFLNNVSGVIVTNAAGTSNPIPLAPEDRNWKDVIVAPPGQVTRVLVRTSRPDGTSFTAQPAGTTNTALLFDPKVGTFPMHCHILEHEENDMMTSFEVK